MMAFEWTNFNITGINFKHQGISHNTKISIN